MGFNPVYHPVGHRTACPLHLFTSSLHFSSSLCYPLLTSSLHLLPRLQHVSSLHWVLGVIAKLNRYKGPPSPRHQLSHFLTTHSPPPSTHPPIQWFCVRLRPPQVPVVPIWLLLLHSHHSRASSNQQLPMKSSSSQRRSVNSCENFSSTPSQSI